MKSPTPYRRLIGGLVLLLLAACSSSPQPRLEADPPPASWAQVRQLLADAERSDGLQKRDLQLEAARQLLELQRSHQAMEVLASVAVGEPTGAALADYSLLMAQAQLNTGNSAGAQDTLLGNTVLNDSLPMLAATQQIRLGELRARLLAQLDQPLASVRERVFIAALITDRNAWRSNHEIIWQTLLKTPADTLFEALGTVSDETLRGWLILALIGRQTQGDIDLQLQQLATWQRQWPTHPAARELPGGLDLLATLAAQRPQRVAVLLPFSGRLAPSGQAVRDGLLAAWHQERAAGHFVPALHFYDSNHENFPALYRQAVADGAALVIGPLEKDRLHHLFDEGTLPVPTLALNEIHDYGSPPAGLYQFALSIDQEAANLAARIRLDNHRHVLLAYAHETWSQRPIDSFRQAWQSAGGTLVAEAGWAQSRQLTATLRETLGLGLSEQRRRAVQTLFGRTLQFEPRRRQDIEAIVLIGTPETGRLVLPMLQYLYSGDVPVYASAHIFSGRVAPERDRDLDRTRFCDMPWLLQPEHPLQQQLAPHLSDHRLPYLRLYGLGADAFQVHARLPQLAQFPDSVFIGYSGLLRLDSERHMQREPACAIFRQGRPQLLPAVAGSP